MTIITDTRETKPLKFKEDGMLEKVVRAKLDHCDYACQYTNGDYAPFFFERKSIGDLYGTMTQGYHRFKDEIKRCKADGHIMILAIEGTYTDVLAGFEHSRFSGASMAKKLMTLLLRYQVYPVFFSSRVEMAAYIRELFEAWGREVIVKQRRKK